MCELTGPRVVESISVEDVYLQIGEITVGYMPLNIVLPYSKILILAAWNLINP